MKFEKYVKQLASTGTIYERENGERWLASPSVYMLIPALTRSVTATGINKIPPEIEKIINMVGNTGYAHLRRAVMPYPDGKIADCLRIYETDNGEFSITISNDDWSLIDKSDVTEILYSYNMQEEQYEVKALLVKQYPELPTEDYELVGIIFPAEIPEPK